jgi:formylglycine-generating enzyme
MNKHRLLRITLQIFLMASTVMVLDSCSFVNKTLGKITGKKGGDDVASDDGPGEGKSGRKGRRGKGNDKEAAGITNGEITATARKNFKQSAPVGMVLIPDGSFVMGQADEDVSASQVNMNKRITIIPFYMDETEITNNEYRQFMNVMFEDSVSVLGEEYIMQKLYPDTTVWSKDFTYHNGDQMTESYYSSPAFDMYPVVGVSWVAAQEFCKWRSKMMNDYLGEHNKARSPSFRLPSEAEWEWAARGNKEGAKYPWGNPYVANSKGCFLANFKPYRGNYRADGYPYTAPSNAFSPNDFGLYNMAGNVAEWCQDAWSDSYMPLTWDMNPVYNMEDEPRKVIKGGSWKDIAYFLETGTKSYEYKEEKRSFIGFRCVMSRLGTVPGRQ